MNGYTTVEAERLRVACLNWLLHQRQEARREKEAHLDEIMLKKRGLIFRRYPTRDEALKILHSSEYDDYRIKRATEAQKVRDVEALHRIAQLSTTGRVGLGSHVSWIMSWAAKGPHGSLPPLSDKKYPGKKELRREGILGGTETRRWPSDEPAMPNYPKSSWDEPERRPAAPEPFKSGGGGSYAGGGASGSWDSGSSDSSSSSSDSSSSSND